MYVFKPRTYTKIYLSTTLVNLILLIPISFLIETISGPIPNKLTMLLILSFVYPLISTYILSLTEEYELIILEYTGLFDLPILPEFILVTENFTISILGVCLYLLWFDYFYKPILQWLYFTILSIVITLSIHLIVLILYHDVTINN